MGNVVSADSRGQFYDRPRWPERVLDLAGAAIRAHEAGRRDELIGELWRVLTTAMSAYVRRHLGSGPLLDPEDINDIVSEKTLDLLRRLDRGDWDPSSGSAAQLCRFVDTLARNGVIDHLRSARVRRRRPLPDGDEELSLAGALLAPAGQSEVESAADASRFVQALEGCAAGMTERARKVWLLRVLHGMPSKAIARHPDVASTTTAVDMMLSRCRAHLAACIRRKGFEPRDWPSGTFVLLWDAFCAPEAPTPAISYEEHEA